MLLIYDLFYNKLFAILYVNALYGFSYAATCEVINGSIVFVVLNYLIQHLVNACDFLAKVKSQGCSATCRSHDVNFVSCQSSDVGVGLVKTCYVTLFAEDAYLVAIGNAAQFGGSEHTLEVVVADGSGFAIVGQSEGGSGNIAVSDEQGTCVGWNNAISESGKLNATIVHYTSISRNTLGSFSSKGQVVGSIALVTKRVEGKLGQGVFKAQG